MSYIKSTAVKKIIPQKGIEILTTPGARKAVTLLYADKSVYKRR